MGVCSFGWQLTLRQHSEVPGLKGRLMGLVCGFLVNAMKYMGWRGGKRGLVACLLASFYCF